MTADGASAVVFPGMAPSNYASVGAFMRADPYVRRRLAIADEALGYSLIDRFRAEDRDYAEAGHIAFVVNCIALADRSTDRYGLDPRLCVGPSFGQMASIAFTGVLPFADLVRLTAEISRCEREYFAEHHRDLVTSFFFRTPEDGLRHVLERMDTGGVWCDVSCFLGDGFYAVTLPEDRVEALEAAIREVRGVPLYTMRPPVHCRAFGALRERLRPVLERFPFAAPRIPLVSDQDGAVVDSAEGVAGLVLDGFVRPVRWNDAAATMQREGIGTVCVPGPSSLFDRLSRRYFDVLAVNPETCSPGADRTA
ncbi:[acyl-carrier-protein] S-malonyltransferase [Murinocardiopsis flavida]|uniref:[acyl-carrier-protein] S-malonyltransferase n=1 Tax=Murinocardiopsis flavida TaxID=645275 RepID=A0A2P8D586_9ACTN|nr:ACP S-malonyltransferase [Murinocardiopsis flavida]PSK92352.1 [acyl-carrier-protein] S-malonyltransferase [Murinocardiopsis flavida]